MTWFRGRREDDDLAAAPQDPQDVGDSPAELRKALADSVRFINSSSGRLPTRAVVNARRVTDTLQAVIDTSDVRPLDVYAVVSVKGSLTDYLPTTLRTYLAVDASMLNTPRTSGTTPIESLLEQIESLQTSASAVLLAAQNQDLDALMTQGNFLRTKFSGSDLDL